MLCSRWDFIVFNLLVLKQVPLISVESNNKLFDWKLIITEFSNRFDIIIELTVLFGVT